MDLFKIFGRIGIDGYDTAKDVLKDVSGEGEKTSSKLGSFFSAIGKGAVAVGKTIASGIAVGSVAIAKIGKDAIGAYADYEQLVGGVETLFKESSDTILEYANNAYKTAGLSANEYMETVTSFSASLLQSLNGDTAKASEYANQAIIDMADNANKMGTSIDAIQNAYQGFAKQNYTMLDNLKLGYGGTKEEMERLLRDAEKISGIKYDISSFADITEAIHVIQTEMGITGTTAKEASTTIQGSISSMKSAWTNLMTGLSDPDQDLGALIENFVNAGVTALGNIVPRITELMPRIASAVQTIVEKLTPMLPKILNEMLPTLIQGAIALIDGLVEALPSIIQAIVNTLPMFIDGIFQIFEGIISTLPSVIDALISALPALIPQLVNGLVNAILVLMKYVPDMIQPIIDNLPAIINAIVIALIDNLPALIDGVIQLAFGLVNATDQIIKTLLPMIPDIVVALVNALIDNIPKILEGIGRVTEEIGKAFWNFIEEVWKLAEIAWEWLVKNIFEPIGNWILDKVINPVVNFFKGMWQSISGFFRNLWNDISSIFSGVANWFKTKLIDPLVGFFKGLGKDIGAVWDGIWNGIKKVVNLIIGGINGMIKGVTTGINFVISGLNKLQFDVPEWVPVIGGKKFGFDIKEITPPQIPLLEKGGVLEKGQVGLLEGKGAEAVVPLENNRKWISAVANDMTKITAKDDSNEKILSAIEELTEAVKNIDPSPELLLDGDKLVGGIIDRINERLGQMTTIKRRGAPA